MTKHEFAVHMGRIIECYGEKNYPNSRTEQIWIWAQRMPSKVFFELTSSLIADCQHPPLLAKFKEHYSQIRVKQPTQKIECAYCNGEGFIPDEKPVPNVYACNCAAGDALPHYVARWNGPWIKHVPSKEELEYSKVNAEKIIKLLMNNKMMLSVPDNFEDDL